ncbi:ABC-2 type transporter [Elusimicrobium minutum Pei191]|uniref:ABC-2 type transporter n=1 Tax=Elusimicrobium minutum (strain Pei191) TaxID=445932 RepID=B2KDI2_ELUMP|nr:ABC transporter permease [Elusimicrobium minutum]ACC98578.1 ABC-2 type transporter [Elusimicrobium minutum Pei191]
MHYKIWYIIKREIQFVFKKKKLVAFYCLAYPLIILGIITTIFSNAVIRRIPIAVNDNSKTAQSKELIRNFDASPFLRVAYYTDNLTRAKDLMQRGKIFAVINIDADFQKDLLKNKSGSVTAYISNQYLLVGGVASKGIIGAVDDFSLKYRTQVLSAMGAPSYLDEAFTTPIGVTESILYNPQSNYIYFLVLGLVPALLQLFVSLTLVYSLLTELKTGSARQIGSLVNKHPFRVINAKMAVYIVLYIAQAALMLSVLFIFFKIPLRGSVIMIILGGAAFTFFCSSIGVLISGLTKSLRMGLSMAGIYSAPAFAYFGVTFPLEAMPLLARMWAFFLPGTHFNRILINEAIRGSGTSGSINAVLIMLGLGAVFFFVGSKLFARWTVDESSWGAS